MAASSLADCSAAANTLPLLVFAYKQKRLLLECTACVPTLWLLLPCSYEKLICSLGKEHTKMNATSSDDLVNFMAAPTTRRQALKALTATTVAAPLALSSIGTALASPKLPQAYEQVHAASGKAEDISAIAQEAMKQNDLQAVILSVSIGNKNIVTTALGQSMTGVPATTQMHFRIGAVAIAYLTTLLLRLVDQRRVRLDDRLSW
jgi:hypothetical protein